jgi:predicted ATPase/DNA-binding SARP family transcriptional activator
MGLEVFLLGRFAVHRDGVEITHWKRAAAKRLLKLLAVAPQYSLRVEQLAAVFWPNDLSDKVRQRLHHLVYLLHDAMASEAQPHRRWVEVRDGVVRLSAANGLSVDADTLEAKVHAALLDPTDLAALKSALDLYRGPLLADEASDLATEQRREQLLQCVKLGWHALAQGQQRVGLLTDAVSTLKRLLTEAPCHEAAHREVMALYAALDQRDEVDRQYAACKAALARDLGLLPSAQTHQAYRDAMLNVQQIDAPGIEEPAHRGTPTRYVPPQPMVTLVDRDAVLCVLKTKLTQPPPTRLLTLLGVGGIGKTQLALRAAHDLAPNLPDGACFVSLAEVDAQTDAELTANGVLDRIRRALRMADSSTLASELAIFDCLRGKHMLLVLDNCEHVASGLGFLNRLLEQAPLLCVLATSRRRLNLAVEHVMDVPPLKPTVSSAVKLFAERASAAAPHFKLTPAVRNDVMAIAAKLEGVPLSIELVASRAQAYSVSELRSALETGFAATVAGGGPDRPERHHSIEQSLLWSYRLLEAQEQSVLRRAAMFQTPFELAALEAACGDLGVDIRRSVQSLQSLGFLNAASARNAVGTPRLQMPAAALAFARKLQEHPRFQENHRGPASAHVHFFSQWFAELAEEMDGALAGGEAAHAMARLDADHDNFFQALALADERGDDAGVSRLVCALSPYWSQSGAWVRADSWVMRAAEIAPTLNLPQRVAVLTRASAYWKESQRYERARDCAKLALTHCKVLKDVATQTRVTLLFSAAVYHLGETAAAITPLTKTARAALAAGLSDIHCAAQNNLGNCYLTLGELARAKATWQECDANRSEREGHLRTAPVMNLGLVAHYTGQDAEAERLMALASELEHRSMARPGRVAAIMVRSAWVWCGRGQALEAERALGLAQSAAQAAELSTWLLICQAHRGKIALVRGQTRLAETLLMQGVADCSQRADPWDVLDIRLWLFWAQHALPGGEARAKATLLSITQTYCRSWHHEHPRILEAAAACLVRDQQFAPAARAWQQAQALRHEQGSKRFAFEQAQARATQAALRKRLGAEWRSESMRLAAASSTSPNASGLLWLGKALGGAARLKASSTVRLRA